MKSLTQTYEIHAPVGKVWQALVDPKMIDQWGAGPAKMNSNVNTKFSLWGGDIHGTNTKAVVNALLEQDWYGGDWSDPSKVTFFLSTVSKDKTNVILKHTDIPDKELDDISDGWKRYYMEPLKEFVKS